MLTKADVNSKIKEINKSIKKYKIADLPNPKEKDFNLLSAGDVILYTNNSKALY